MGFLKNYLNKIQDQKHEKQMAKIELKEKRADNRLEKVKERQETKGIAYQNKIDPNAAMWQGISNLGSSTAGVLTGGMTSINQGGGASSLTGEKEKKNQLLIIFGVVAAVIIGFFAIKKRR